MSTERLIVDAKVADAFVAKLADKVATLRAGDPAGVDSVLGSLVDASAGTRIKALIDGALGKGAQLVVGGQLDGSILQQTLLDGVDETMSLYHEESFGPVAVMLRGEGDEALLRLANDSEFGLSAAISSSFYQPLNNLANSLKQFNQNTIQIVGYTDSTGSRQLNMDLSQRRAQSVANYLTSQGVNGANLSAGVAGPHNPMASNADVNGRAQNRRVEVNLGPIPGQQAPQQNNQFHGNPYQQYQ